MIKLVQQESAKIYLDTFSDNIKAIGLYKKCGFKRVKRYVVEGQESSLFRWSKQDA
jgi:RimJ/RimL family protein N-acetyltransferase